MTGKKWYGPVKSATAPIIFVKKYELYIINGPTFTDLLEWQRTGQSSLFF